MLIDTHTHLYASEFNEDRAEVIARAIDAGVSHFVIPSIDSTFTQAMYQLEKDYPNMYLLMGLHPTHAKENCAYELQHIENELAKRPFYGIGEIGIDLYWDKTHLKEQQFAFIKQIQLAKQYNLPVIIHCRDAFDEVFEILEQEKANLFGIFHCFSGDYDQAIKAISYNMKLGIGGVVTFKNGKLDQFLSKIDITNIVLETDAPYLAPVPYRGKRNESAYMTHIASKLSEIYNLTTDEIATITTANVASIFRL